jgi:polyphosphate kinase
MAAVSGPGAAGRWRAHPRYLNRELSWLAFNERVLSEASSASNPLLERAKFLAIFESNLDEFFMVRVSGLIEQHDAGLTEPTPDGMTAGEQLEMIAELSFGLRRRAGAVWSEELGPALCQAGYCVVPKGEWSSADARVVAKAFEDEVFPVSTPLMVDPSPTMPFISNRSFNLAVRLSDGHSERLARIKVPPVVPHLIPLPGPGRRFARLEDVLASSLDRFFPGVEIVSHHKFRVVRDADIELRELEAPDLISAVEQSLRLRRFGDPVLLQVGTDTPGSVERTLLRGLELGPESVWRLDDPVSLEFCWQLAKVEDSAHRYPRFAPATSERLATSDALFAEIARRDVLLHHPYDSFRPVEAFFEAAAADPKVVGIKATLYRVGAESPIVESLLRAAERNKQVAAMIELKARFDESNNLVWSRALEKAGAHVTYGFHELKVHAKIALVVRHEQGGIRQYAHIGTGNYNPETARLYTDFGLFTSDPDVCRDVTELFNYLTGFSRHSEYRKLLVAPINLRDRIIEMIEREAALHAETGGGWIDFKLNSLVDPEVIDALYEASRVGVPIRLVVRGICCLRAHVPGLSDNIGVVSVVGRFLEHSRAYLFGNGGSPEAWIGSADLMRRNLDRRVEALVPVTDPAHIAYLRSVVDAAFLDNVKAWSPDPDGVYAPRRPEGPAFESQAHLIAHPAAPLVERP